VISGGGAVPSTRTNAGASPPRQTSPQKLPSAVASSTSPRRVSAIPASAVSRGQL
jgi:hypothetical protein